ncbi:MAG: hypothetical protein N3C62_03885 [Synergistetes bacterium]|nr:hypothetical protein [Synergistota bacterium]MCX8127868.1 hypothetical protein [Synergistota bacterium]MDW8192130.1 transcription antitermination factor NusB [Synergistota bacterium]
MREKIWEEYAFDILIKVEKGGWLEPLLRSSIDSGKIPSEASRFVTDICYGVVRYIYLLKWIARRLVGEKKWAKLPNLAKWIILIGLYQLRFHSSEKAPFICFRLVELAKKYFHGGIGNLVNAVLRAYLREKVEPPQDNLALKFSYPEWLVEALLGYFKDEEFVKELLKRGNDKPKLYVHVNLKKTDEEAFSISLKEKGLILEKIPLLKGCFLIRSSVFPRDIPGWDEGLFWMESLSSMLAVKSLEIQEGDNVLDLCAGRGVKSADIAQRLNGKGKLVSVDIYPWKLKVLRSFLSKLSYKADALIAMDLRILDPKLKSWASKILLDVPCSNLADLGGKPEIKLRITPAGIRELVNLQKSLIDVSSAYLKRGGYLVYSTCTFFPEENEEIVREFLKIHPEYEILNPEWLKPMVMKATDYGYYIEDGFFALLLRR